MTTKRELERRLAALEEAAADEPEKGRPEIHLGGGFMYGTEPHLTDFLRSIGFVVEREERCHGNEHEDVLLETAPPALGVFNTTSWNYPGRTAVREELRIIWEDDALEKARGDADHPVTYAEPDMPENPIVVTEDEGWMAVAPVEHVITSMIHRRANAEFHGFDILDPVELPIQGATEYDLVKVDADPNAERRPRAPDV